MQCNFARFYQRFLLSRAKQPVFDIRGLLRQWPQPVVWDMTACSPLFRRHLQAASILEVRQDLEQITPPSRQLLSTFLHGVTSHKSVNFTDAISNNRDKTAVGHFSFFQFYRTTFWTQIQLLSYGSLASLVLRHCLSHTLHDFQQRTHQFGDYYAFTAHQMWARRPKILLHRKAGTALSAVTTLWAGRPGVRNPACSKVSCYWMGNGVLDLRLKRASRSDVKSMCSHSSIPPS
jgi:hypothetical protein